MNLLLILIFFNWLLIVKGQLSGLTSTSNTSNPLSVLNTQNSSIVPTNSPSVENIPYSTELISKIPSALSNLLSFQKSSTPTPFLYQNIQPQCGTPTVKTLSGEMKGVASSTGFYKMAYYAFLGIPYAKPPVGDLRFRYPWKVTPWTGIYDATFERSGCIGQSGNGMTGNEDCLYLNIFTPNIICNGQLKAVLFFIPGGAFVAGSSNTSVYSPDFLIEHDVILVTINYRLGAFGFLYTGTEKVPGNAGLEDQRVALEWIKNNIIYFCGNPDRITIQGESAGGASIIYHILSVTSQGLFSQAISESGTATSWAYVEPYLAKQYAIQLCIKAGCLIDCTDEEELLECLQEQPYDVIFNEQKAIPTIQNLARLITTPFLPTQALSVPGAFMAKNPWQQLVCGDFKRVPVLMGSNSKEALIILTYLQYDPLNLLVTTAGLNLANFVACCKNPSIEMTSQINKKMKEFYYSPTELTLSQSTCVDIITDAAFLYPIQKTVEFFAYCSTVPVYNYYFTYDGPFGFLKVSSNINGPGVAHADELGYLFCPAALYKNYMSEPPNSTAWLTVSRLTTLWTNFAKTGNPTPETNDLIPEIWAPFQSGCSFYNISATLESKKKLQVANVSFWDGICGNCGFYKDQCTNC